MKKISLLGLGNWGTGIANMVANNNHKVVAYSVEHDCVQEVNIKHTNSKYSGSKILSNNIEATTDLEKSIENVDYIFITLPSVFVRNVLENLKKVKVNFEKKFVIFTKGIDSETEKFFSDVVLEYFPNAEVAVLSGPNFAVEVLEEKATITTVACKNKNLFFELEKILNCAYFNIKYFDDPIAVQLCGLVKNVLAILCGISEGLELGKNTFSAIIMKGLEEINNLCIKYNCNREVINTPAGIGDIILTCSSIKSRNMSFGFQIGEGKNIQEILKSSTSTIEGLSNAETLTKIYKKLNINNSVADIILTIVKNNYNQSDLKNIIVNNLFK